MPKRKRGGDDTSVGAIFSRYRNDLHQALKTVRGFERQRQSKRLRDAKSTAEKKARIENEIAVLKSLDLQQTAHAHLCSSLVRLKPIAESDKLPGEIKAGVPKPELTNEEKAALHNVTSSLYNRPEVKSVVEKAIEEVCNAVGVAVPEKKGRARGKDRPEGADNPRRDEEGAKKHQESRGVSEGGKVKGKEREGPKKVADGEDHGIEEEEEEKAVSQLDALLGLGSDEEGDDEEEEEVLVKGRTRKSTAAAKDLDPMEITSEEEVDEQDDDDDLDSVQVTSDEGSDDEDVFEGFSDLDEGNQDGTANEDISDGESSVSSMARSPPAEKAATSKKPPKTKTRDSTFLPTLMGGYISGSESEASDIDVAPPRKNRRGQRARQAIWEKKYKEQAKHLQKQATKGRDAGWDLKRGAVDGDSKPWKRGIRNPLLDKPKGSGSAQPPPKREPPKRTRDDSGPLHPSWEAKRLARERERMAAPYQGRKITFD
ncbi:Protein bud22 [Madurella mycetomatis]|uniref:Protein bud22 n=1 Tax=Madurella mycetomatis TaxID=100816 RepID=A0A175VRC6_9PEZI|nr:Protein bud22 [Madurella mycetomatis]